MRPISELEEGFEINLLPMIDVIFSILAFFIISTLFLSQLLTKSETTFHIHLETQSVNIIYIISILFSSGNSTPSTTNDSLLCSRGTTIMDAMEKNSCAS